jgi:hypothetical protein
MAIDVSRMGSEGWGRNEREEEKEKQSLLES